VTSHKVMKVLSGHGSKACCCLNPFQHNNEVHSTLHFVLHSQMLKLPQHFDMLWFLLLCGNSYHHLGVIKIFQSLFDWNLHTLLNRFTLKKTVVSWNFYKIKLNKATVTHLKKMDKWEVISALYEDDWLALGKG
jgi:hypothetical protein